MFRLNDPTGSSSSLGLGIGQISRVSFLDIFPHISYTHFMKAPMNPTIAEIEASLAISEAQVARGETLLLAPILKRLHVHADRLDAKAANIPGQRTASRP